ncbi:MAG: hypothetical protein K2X49_07885 [Acetobacteraceae bacterium]|nr:hypothetical protein [Acetobacteraceae bacterium]
MQDAAALATLKAQLLRSWDEGGGGDDQDLPAGVARFQALNERGPRPGLAIGHSRRSPEHPPRVELRVAGTSRSRLARARRIKAQAQAEGLDTMLKVIARPIIALFGSQQVQPFFGGRRQPLHLGCAVANEKGSTGTLGAFVRLDDGREGLLSCAHVLARRRRGPARVGDPIQHPGPPEAPVPAHRVGSLSDRFAPLVPARDNGLKNIDAAVAILAPGAAHAGNRLPAHDALPAGLRGRVLPAPLDSEELLEGTPVVKLGRMTGLTRGLVTAIAIENLHVGFGSSTDTSFCFSGVHEVAWEPDAPPYAVPGDSGSIVLREESLQPIGIHFCSMTNDNGESTSYIVPWTAIGETLGVTML